MQTVLTYLISLLVIVITVFITLIIKSELERMFREKNEVKAYHICNVVTVLMTSFTAYAVTTIFIFGNDMRWILQVFILLFIILPIYFFGNLSFEKYKAANRKYVIAESGKVLVINEKFLNRK
jgi:amino acid transporter